MKIWTDVDFCATIVSDDHINLEMWAVSGEDIKERTNSIGFDMVPTIKTNEDRWSMLRPHQDGVPNFVLVELTDEEYEELIND